MIINKTIFDSIFDECLDIIHSSSDKAILNKEEKLNKAYKKLVENNDNELQEFYSIVHELRTYHLLKTKGLSVTAQNDNKKGPDFYCEELGYIECVSVTRGEKGTECRKYVEKCLARISFRYLAALPRITSVITDKKKKFEDYLSKRIIDSQVPRIIAINTSVFSNLVHSDLMFDLFLQILYGIGNQVLWVRRNPISFIDEGEGVETHRYNDKGYKQDNLELDLAYFEKEEYQNISAIILVKNAITEKDIENNFIIFTNPLANVPINVERLRAFNVMVQRNKDDNMIRYEILKANRLSE